MYDEDINYLNKKDQEFLEVNKQIIKTSNSLKHKFFSKKKD